MLMLAMIGVLAAAVGSIILVLLFVQNPLPIIAVSAVSAAAFRLLLARRSPCWTARRALLVSSGILPLFVWLLAFAVDVTAAIQHAYHPDEPFMVGFSPLLFPICVIGFFAGLISATLVRLRRSGSD